MFDLRGNLNSSNFRTGQGDKINYARYFTQLEKNLLCKQMMLESSGDNEAGLDSRSGDSS